ncbi:hypothetical protein Dimus_018325 [Dionaea muscipula]
MEGKANRKALSAGGWQPVLRKNYRRNIHRRVALGYNVTIYIEDIPDDVNVGELRRMFWRFGVVKDVFILRKKNRSGRRFGFVQYDCDVEADVAVQRSNGMWLRGKQLCVSKAKYAKKKQQHTDAKDNRTRESSVTAARISGSSEALLPSVRGVALGNAWLYQSAVAKFRDYRNLDVMFESFMKMEGSTVTVRRMGRSKVLITFQREDLMKIFVDLHRRLSPARDSLERVGRATRLVVMGGMGQCFGPELSGPLKFSSGSVFNPSGINLEVVLNPVEVCPHELLEGEAVVLGERGGSIRSIAGKKFIRAPMPSGAGKKSG